MVHLTSSKCNQFFWLLLLSHFIKVANILWVGTLCSLLSYVIAPSQFYYCVLKRFISYVENNKNSPPSYVANKLEFEITRLCHMLDWMHSNYFDCHIRSRWTPTLFTAMLNKRWLIWKTTLPGKLCRLLVKRKCVGSDVTLITFLSTSLDVAAYVYYLCTIFGINCKFVFTNSIEIGDVL